jgi:hypothetical protein
MKIFSLGNILLALCAWSVSAQVNPFGQTPSAVQNGTGPLPAIRLNNEPLSAVLDIYAQCTGRSVLHPTLPAMSFTLNATATNQAEVASIITAALKEKGIITVLDGDEFVRVMPESWTDTAPFRSPQTNTSPGLTVNGTKSSGAIDIINLPIQQVFPIYAAVAGARGFDQDINYQKVPPVLIAFKSQTPMGKAEAMYALDTLFNWSAGIKVVPSANGMLKVVRLR